MIHAMTQDPTTAARWRSMVHACVPDAVAVIVGSRAVAGGGWVLNPDAVMVLREGQPATTWVGAHQQMSVSQGDPIDETPGVWNVTTVTHTPEDLTGLVNELAGMLGPLRPLDHARVDLVSLSCDTGRVRSLLA
jgi:hypothetical protein